jgi:hypothetical protein
VDLKVGQRSTEFVAKPTKEIVENYSKTKATNVGISE